jgi:hypothetical protein
MVYAYRPVKRGTPDPVIQARRRLKMSVYAKLDNRLVPLNSVGAHVEGKFYRVKRVVINRTITATAKLMMGYRANVI